MNKNKIFRNQYKVKSEKEILSEIYGAEMVKKIDERTDKIIAKRIKKEGVTPSYDSRPAQYYYVVMDGNNETGISEKQYLDENYTGYKKKIMISRYPGPDGIPSVITVGHLDHRTEEEKQADKEKGWEY